MKLLPTISIPADWRELPKKDFDWVMERITWTREQYRNGVQYVAGGNPAGIELDNGKFYLHPMFTQQEPESLSALRQFVPADDDQSRAARIWLEFRVQMKKKSLDGGLSWLDVQALVEAAIKRVRKQVKDPAVRNQVNGRLIVMRNRVKEFVTDPDAANASLKSVCPKCKLSEMLCTCGVTDWKGTH